VIDGGLHSRQGVGAVRFSMASALSRPFQQERSRFSSVSVGGHRAICAELGVAWRTAMWTRIRNCESSTANRIRVILVDGGSMASRRWRSSVFRVALTW
jgi:hypothetical protein